MPGSLDRSPADITSVPVVSDYPVGAQLSGGFSFIASMFSGHAGRRSGRCCLVGAVGITLCLSLIACAPNRWAYVSEAGDPLDLSHAEPCAPMDRSAHVITEDAPSLELSLAEDSRGFVVTIRNQTDKRFFIFSHGYTGRFDPRIEVIDQSTKEVAMVTTITEVYTGSEPKVLEFPPGHTAAFIRPFANMGGGCAFVPESGRSYRAMCAQDFFEVESFNIGADEYHPVPQAVHRVRSQEIGFAWQP